MEHFTKVKKKLIHYRHHYETNPFIVDMNTLYNSPPYYIPNDTVYYAYYYQKVDGTNKGNTDEEMKIAFLLIIV